jgi:hypothetical protein
MDRLLPVFDKIDEEAKQKEEEAFKRLCARSPSDDPDIAMLGECAMGEAVDYLSMMGKMKQAQINLQIVGLYHLFEQQMCEMHRRLEFSSVGIDVTVEIKLRQVKDALLADHVAIEKLPTWAKVNELRLVANCAKHAEGDACKCLRKLRPNLLTPARCIPGPIVLNPLGGEDLYADRKDFEEYAAGLRSFWLELATVLP